MATASAAAAGELRQPRPAVLQSAVTLVAGKGWRGRHSPPTVSRTFAAALTVTAGEDTATDG